jgi:hypothetical protein
MQIYNLLLQPLGSELMWLDKGASRGEGFDCCSLASLSRSGTENVPGDIDNVIARIRVCQKLWFLLTAALLDYS